MYVHAYACFVSIPYIRFPSKTCFLHSASNLSALFGAAQLIFTVDWGAVASANAAVSLGAEQMLRASRQRKE